MLRETSINEPLYQIITVIIMLFHIKAFSRFHLTSSWSDYLIIENDGNENDLLVNFPPFIE